MSRRTIHAATNVALVTGAAEHIKGRVLDVGCGSQPFKRLFSYMGKFREGVTDWVGCDIRPVADVVADATKLPFEDESFDTVLCVDTLQYVRDPFTAMREFSRVLKAGGTLILVAPNTSSDDDLAFWNFKANGMSLLCDLSGLTAVDIKAGGNLWTGEYKHYATQLKYGVGTPEGFMGFIGMLENDYPFMGLLIAERK